MDAVRWQQISRLYQAARAKPDADRSAFLIEACAGDEHLRQELESLLACDASTDEFLKVSGRATLSERTQSESDLLPGPPQAGTTLGTYRIERLLGRGGMGTVFLAYDTTLHRRVALKVIETSGDAQTSGARILREARNAAALNHPNICTIYEVGHADGVTFIAMEYVEGRSVRERLVEGPLPLEEAVRYGIQAGDALAYAHNHGVVHRDFKAANVVVTEAAHLKIIDFGLARRADPMMASTRTMPSLVAAGTVAGTPYAMAPEQVRGDATDARTDIWALGVLLYEMVTGAPPFAAATVPELFSSILRDSPVRPAAVSIEIGAVIERCLAKEPARRFQTAADVRSALATLGSEVRHTPAVAGRFPAVQRSDPVDSVAVLPFVNASADPNVEYLSDGITETLINSLSQLPHLRVKSRQSVFRYKGRQADAQTVGRELAVRAVLVGQVVQRGDSLAISAELIDARSEDQIWGEQYHRKLTDVMRIQEEIAVAISGKLRVKLNEEDHAQMTKRYTEKAEAYQNYLKGRYWWNKRTREGIRKGIEYFKEAIEADPSYALPYGGLADSYALLAGVQPSKDVFPSAKAAALKALEFDDRLAEAHTSLAYIYTHYDWNWSDAEKEYLRAIELNPNYPAAHSAYAKYLTAMGRFDEATSQINLARDLDPLSPGIASGVAGCFYAKRQYDQAIKRYREVLDMEPRFAAAHFSLGDVYLAKSMFDKAIEEYQTGLQLSPNDATAVAELGHVYSLAGRRADALASLEKVMQSSKQGYVLPSSIALIHAGLGDKDAAFHWLDKGFEDRSWPMVYLKVEPRFDSLRSDPRFYSLLTRIGLPV